MLILDPNVCEKKLQSVQTRTALILNAHAALGNSELDAGGMALDDTHAAERVTDESYHLLHLASISIDIQLIPTASRSTMATDQTSMQSGSYTDD